MGLPLEGIRVVDITVVWAGPHCTQLLAEWGAEVIRVEPRNRAQPNTRTVERITREDVLRLRASGQGPQLTFPDNDPAEAPWNRYAGFNSHARNKRSITLDIMSPEGRDTLRRLVAVSDVLVENNAADMLEKAHATWEDLREVNPRLIMTRMTAYGLDGPYKYYRSFGNHMEGVTGQHYLRGYANTEPDATGNSFTADAAGGIHGAMAIVMALRQRKMTGKGQQIEVPLAETTLPYLGEIILDYTMNGRTPEPSGNAHPYHAPHGAYPCSGDDRWIAIDVASDAQWRALADTIGDDWAAQEEFATCELRLANQARLDKLLSAWTRTQDVMALFHTLQSAGVTAGPVQDEEMAYDCPHMAERGFFLEIDQPECGPQVYPGINIKMEETTPEIWRHPVMLGEDNDYVYREVIGLTETEYDFLKERGHIGTDYLDSAYS